MEFADEVVVVARGTSIILLGTLVMRVLGFILNVVVLARYLAKDAFGLFNIAISVPDIAFFLVFNGLSEAMVSQVSSYTAQGKPVSAKNSIMLSFALRGGIGAAITASVFFSADHISLVLENPTAVKPLQLAAFTVFVNYVVDVFLALFQAFRRSEVFIGLQLFQTALTLGLTYLLFMTRVGVTEALLANLITGMVCVMLALFFGRVIIHGNLGFPKVPGHSEEGAKRVLIGLLVFGLQITAYNCLKVFQRRALTPLLGLYSTEVEAAYFSMAAFMAEIVAIGPGAVALLLFPTFSAAYARRDKEILNRFYTAMIKYVMFLAGPLGAGVILVSKPFFSIINPEYLPALPAIILMVAASTINAFSCVWGSAMRGINKPNLGLIGACVATAVNLALNYSFLANYDAVHAAFTSFVHQVLWNLISIYLVNREIRAPFPWIYFMKLTGILALTVLGSYSSMILLRSPALQMVCGIIVFLIVYYLLAVLVRIFSWEEISIATTILERYETLGKVIIPLLRPLGRIPKDQV